MLAADRAMDATQNAAAGVVFIAPDNAVLLLCRSAQEANYGGFWSLPGGKADEGETPWEAACRECAEEIGVANTHAWVGQPTEIEAVATPTGMTFTTFAQPVRYRFAPELNSEHDGFVWAKAGNYPSPMHPQVARVLAALFPEGSEEVQIEVDAASDALALDRATVRSKDADGHLHVEVTPISKANVCPYKGDEIPGWRELNLTPDRIYNLYRDPEELEKAAPTFARKPVLIVHKGVTAATHDRRVVIGALGDSITFKAPYLMAPMTIWDGEGINLIESGDQQEISSSYRYKPVMVPGITPDGEAFDGRMTEIFANHVAIVDHGRAGPDVLVHDNMPAGLAATTPSSAIPAAVAKRATAHDDKETEMSLMERLKGTLSAEDYKALDEMLTAGKANDEEEDDKKAKDEEVEVEVKGKKADDEDMDDKAKANDEDDDDGDKANDKAIALAVDSAVTVAVKSAVANVQREQAAIRDAERFVRPWVGDLAIAFDSAADVYKAAIEANGRTVKDVHPSAYKAILEMMPKPGQKTTSPRIAMDSAKSNGFAERFPETGRIGVSLR
jgi:hypothetical protein